MNASTEPTGDGELLRLLDAYGLAERSIGAIRSNAPMSTYQARRRNAEDNRAALLAYLAAHCVSRKEIASHDDRHNY